MLSQWLAVAVGGAIGATARYGLSTTIYQSLGKSFPYGTLAVNVIGCLLIGLASVHWIERVTFGDTWRLFLIIGVFGGFTTFSTFSLETIQLLQQGELVLTSPSGKTTRHPMLPGQPGLDQWVTRLQLTEVGSYSGNCRVNDSVCFGRICPGTRSNTDNVQRAI